MTPTAHAPAQPPPSLGEVLSRRERFLLLNALMVAMFISALDSSIVSTAMPRILADLGGFELISWVFTVYLLASTIVVPIFGKLSDMFGRKPFILVGIFVFVAASAACGAAPNMPFLIVARGLQGVGGGMMISCVFATLGDLFTPIERAKYMGYFFATFTLASISGPTIGGILTDGPGWRWCFFINLPIGAVATAAVWKTMPYRRSSGRLASIDFGGAALLSVATIALLLGLVWSNERYGWFGFPTLALFATAATFTVVFVVNESRHPQAIIPISLFRNRTFVQANLIIIFSGGAIFGTMQYLPIFIQTALGASATASGVVSTPQALGFLAASIGAGQLVARTRRYKHTVLAGSVVMCVVAFFLHRINASTSTYTISALMVCMGVGSGFAQPMMSVLIQSAVPRSQIGVASSARQFFFQISTVVAIAAYGVIFANTYQSSFEEGVPPGLLAALPGSDVEELRDPTLTLDPDRYREVSDSIRALPNGEATLELTAKSQRDAVSAAIDRIFLVATFTTGIVVIVAITLANRPLASTHAADEPGEAVALHEGA